MKELNELSDLIGLTIARIHLEEGYKLILAFTNGNAVRIKDQFSLCCESRFMRTDDDLTDIIGGRILGIEIKPCATYTESMEPGEIEFLEIATDKGFVTISNHNDHNGYYGGFDIGLKQIPNLHLASSQ